MTKQLFSKKILGKKEGTFMVCHRISVKFYENGAIIKPIKSQGIGIGDKWEYQIENQKAIFLTDENIYYLMNALRTHKTKHDLAETIIKNNEKINGEN